MTVLVSFNAPQIQVNNSNMGIQLSQVILPYSIHNLEDVTQYLGGQMTLGQSDEIKLSDNTKDWERLGLAKIKNMVANAEIYVSDTIIEAPVNSEAPTSETVSEVTTPSSETDESDPVVEE